MSLVRQKIGLFALLSAAVTLLYFGAQHSTLFDATPMPVMTLDRAIPFVAAFIVPYLSFFLLILIPLVVIGDPLELRDAVFGFGLIVVVSTVTFVLWPTMISSGPSN